MQCVVDISAEREKERGGASVLGKFKYHKVCFLITKQKVSDPDLPAVFMKLYAPQ